MVNVSRTMLFSGTIAAVAFLMQAAAPDGWFLAGSKPSNYETGLDAKALHGDRPSAFMKAKTDMDGFGTLLQGFSAAKYIGKRVRFSGWVKSEGVTRWAGLWMRVDGPNYNQSLAFDNMQDRAVKGTTGWQKYDVVLDVKETATNIYLGILLDGPGEVWISSAGFEEVGLGVPVTSKFQAVAPVGPQNLNFDK